MNCRSSFLISAKCWLGNWCSVGIDSISQDLNFQNNVNITRYSKETSILNQQSEEQSHRSIRISWEYNSSISKVVKHIAWIVKLKRNWVASKYNLNKPNFKHLSVDKLKESESIIWKPCQNESYHEKIEILQKHGTLRRTNYCSRPYIYGQFIICWRTFKIYRLRFKMPQPNYNW